MLELKRVDPRATRGLLRPPGKDLSAVEIEIERPSGARQELTDVAADEHLAIQES
jgi:hypothetical protein